MIRYSLGFKFIGNKAKELEEEGLHVPFGYEEAIGYMIGTEIRDKDGIAATVSQIDQHIQPDVGIDSVQSKVCFADLALALSLQNKTVSGYLKQLYAK